MAISRAEVEKVSLLARLLLSEEELDRLTVQMGQVLDYMQLLGEVDTGNVEPMAHAVQVCDVLRKDEVQASLTPQQAMANAPSSDGECYLVPAVLGF